MGLINEKIFQLGMIRLFPEMEDISKKLSIAKSKKNKPKPQKKEYHDISYYNNLVDIALSSTKLYEKKSVFYEKYYTNFTKVKSNFKSDFAKVKSGSKYITEFLLTPKDNSSYNFRFPHIPNSSSQLADLTKAFLDPKIDYAFIDAVKKYASLSVDTVKSICNSDEIGYLKDVMVLKNLYHPVKKYINPNIAKEKEKIFDILNERRLELGYSHDSLVELHKEYITIMKENVTIKKMLAEHYKEFYNDPNDFYDDKSFYSHDLREKKRSISHLYYKLFDECEKNVEDQLSSLDKIVNGNFSHWTKVIHEYINPFSTHNYRNNK